MNGVTQIIGKNQDSKRKAVLIAEKWELQLQIAQHDDHAFIDLTRHEAKEIGTKLLEWANQ